MNNYRVKLLFVDGTTSMACHCVAISDSEAIRSAFAGLFHYEHGKGPFVVVVEKNNSNIWIQYTVYEGLP